MAYRLLLNLPGHARMKSVVFLIYLLLAILTWPALASAQGPEAETNLVKLTDQELAAVSAQGVQQQMLSPDSAAVILWDEVSRGRVASANTSSTQSFSRGVSVGSMMVR